MTLAFSTHYSRWTSPDQALEQLKFVPNESRQQKVILYLLSALVAKLLGFVRVIE